MGCDNNGEDAVTCRLCQGPCTADSEQQKDNPSASLAGSIADSSSVEMKNSPEVEDAASSIRALIELETKPLERRIEMLENKQEELISATNKLLELARATKAVLFKQ